LPKTIRQIDWEKYEEIYPDRYSDPSVFDGKVHNEIARLLTKAGSDVLNIGGGKSSRLHRAWLAMLCREPKTDPKFWLLDPYVTCPGWMESVDWDTEKQFDLIICRGSFNYLQRQQIIKIPDMLKPGGCFLFNTFYKPKNGSRRYTNTKSGTKGVEKFQCRGKVVIHRLEPDGEDYVIQHEIKVRSVDDIVKLLGANGLTLEFLGPNTLFVKLERENA